MAGHSKFKTIMHRKGAQDAKRAKLFSKLAREITTAARGSPDPVFNPRLRLAIATAKAASMPKDNIDRALKKAEGGDAENYEEIRYEGFGPGGVSVIVETLTDNRNRTVSDIRTAFAKNGGNVGDSGSVSYGFDRMGLITYPADAASADTMFESAVEAGAEDVESGDDEHDIWTAAEELHEVARQLEERLGEASGAKLAWRPQNWVTVDEENARKLMQMIEALEDLDDVQAVYGNYDVPDEIMARL